MFSFFYGVAAAICLSPTGPSLHQTQLSTTINLFSNSTVYHYQPILQAGILQSKMEVGEILAQVNMSSPVSLVGSSGNQVAPPDSYAMFRHLMEAKVTHKR